MAVDEDGEQGFNQADQEELASKEENGMRADLHWCLASRASSPASAEDLPKSHPRTAATLSADRPGAEAAAFARTIRSPASRPTPPTAAVYTVRAASVRPSSQSISAKTTVAEVFSPGGAAG